MTNGLICSSKPAEVYLDKTEEIQFTKQELTVIPVGLNKGRKPRQPVVPEPRQQQKPHQDHDRAPWPRRRTSSRPTSVLQSSRSISEKHPRAERNQLISAESQLNLLISGFSLILPEFKVITDQTRELFDVLIHFFLSIKSHLLPL